MKTGFGFIEIGGITYTHDVVIHTDGSVSKREKKKSKGLKEEYGHTPLSEHELDILAREDPAAVYIGTGQYGSLPVTKNAAGILGKYSAVIAPTPDIISALEDEDRHYLAILHITCWNSIPRQGAHFEVLMPWEPSVQNAFPEHPDVPELPSPVQKRSVSQA